MKGFLYLCLVVSIIPIGQYVAINHGLPYDDFGNTVRLYIFIFFLVLLIVCCFAFK